MSDGRIPWRYTADYYESCNCNYGCPCNFNGFPTKGFCEAVVGLRIREGRHGDVDLAGTQFVMAVKWPKAIHDGDGTAALFFDDATTNDKQREALGRILTAQDGGLPYEIIATTLTTVLGPFVEKVDFTWNDTDSSVKVGSKLTSQLQTFTSPVPPHEPQEVHVVVPTGFIFQDAKAANVSRLNVDLEGLKFSNENTNGFYAVVEHSNQA